MRLRFNSLKDKLRASPFVIGTFLEIPSPQLVELLGLAGFDFVVIDAEHGPIDLEKMEGLIGASLSTELSPVVRVADCSEVAIRQPLDLGAAGIHVPQIKSVQMAEEARRRSKYSSQGERGLQPFVRAASYGSCDPGEYIENANAESVLVLHIEGEEGIGALDGILQVEGLDVVFIGPYDLSQSLGLPGQIRHPRVRDKMVEVIKKAKAAGKQIGTYCESVDSAKEWTALGVSYLTVSIDAYIFLSSARRIIQGLRGPGL